MQLGNKLRLADTNYSRSSLNDLFFEFLSLYFFFFSLAQLRIVVFFISFHSIIQLILNLHERDCRI